MKCSAEEAILVCALIDKLRNVQEGGSVTFRSVDPDMDGRPCSVVVAAECIGEVSVSGANLLECLQAAEKKIADMIPTSLLTLESVSRHPLSGFVTRKQVMDSFAREPRVRVRGKDIRFDDAGVVTDFINWLFGESDRIELDRMPKDMFMLWHIAGVRA